MNSNRYFSQALAAVVIAGLTCVPLADCWAQSGETAVKQSESSDLEGSEGGDGNTNVEVLVEQIGSGSFQERTEATRDLLAAGAEAVPALVDAATSGNTEARQRSLVILEKLVQNPDKAIVAALEELLKRKDANTEFKEVAEKHHDLAHRSLLDKMAKDQMAELGIELEMGKGFIQLTSRTGNHMRLGPDSSTRSMKTDDGLNVLVMYRTEKHLIAVNDAKGAIWMQTGSTQDGKTTVHSYQFDSAESMKENNPRLHAEFKKLKQIKKTLDALKKLVEESQKEQRGEAPGIFE